MLVRGVKVDNIQILWAVEQVRVNLNIQSFITVLSLDCFGIITRWFPLSRFLVSVLRWRFRLRKTFFALVWLLWLQMISRDRLGRCIFRGSSSVWLIVSVRQGSLPTRIIIRIYPCIYSYGLSKLLSILVITWK